MRLVVRANNELWASSKKCLTNTKAEVVERLNGHFCLPTYERPLDFFLRDHVACCGRDSRGGWTRPRGSGSIFRLSRLTKRVPVHIFQQWRAERGKFHMRGIAPPST